MSCRGKSSGTVVTHGVPDPVDSWDGSPGESMAREAPRGNEAFYRSEGSPGRRGEEEAGGLEARRHSLEILGRGQFSSTTSRFSISFLDSRSAP
jgi:hypothetical protein